LKIRILGCRERSASATNRGIALLLPAVAKLSPDGAIQQQCQRTLLQLRITCNKDLE
jgi:hypothetical protein